MSIRYRSNNGTETIVSGLTPGGDLEYGAVATRTGAITVPTNTNCYPYYREVVQFDEAMPDGEYLVNYSITSIGKDDAGKFDFAFNTYTASGFSFYMIGNGATTAATAIDWTAYKLYTVQHAAQNAADIAEIKAAMPAGAGVSNKLATTSQLNNAVNPLTTAVSNIQDVIPTDASITNKLVSQDTLDSELEEADEGIWEAMGKNSAKNYFQSTAIDVGTHSGVTMVRNNDGSFSFSGTCSSETGFSLGAPLQKEDWTGYILSGCPVGGGSSTFYLRRRITDSSGTFIRHDCDYGQGVALTALGADEYGTISVVIKTGQVMDGITISPMVRLPQDTDSTYQPYALTNQQITEQIVQIAPAAQSISNPNLLDNPWFTINQRGQSSYTASHGQYTFDRWRATNACNISSNIDNGVSITPINKYGRIGQIIENGDRFNGITMTLSILYKTNDPNYTLQFEYKDGGYTFGTRSIPVSNEYRIFSTTASSLLIEKLIISISGTSTIPSSSIDIKAVKLEVGQVSTLANDVAPNYTTELLKCQRYYYELNNANGAMWMPLGLVHFRTASTAFCHMFLPTMMRSTPTVVLSDVSGSTINYPISGGTDLTPTACVVNAETLQSVSLQITVAESVTANTCGEFWLKTTIPAKLTFSAEL